MDMNGVTTLYLTKNHSLDMRYRANREYVRSNRKSSLDLSMQKIANSLGSPVFFGGNLHWSHYLNPFFHLKQWRFRRTPMQFYGNTR